MGKDGPCYHCGITSSPLWRNGPPGKPVLCNACGSRYRTKGTLANYNPLHAQLLASPGSLEEKLPPLHIATTWHVRKHFEKSMDNGQLDPSYYSYATNSEGDMSNISCSDSALSALESSGHLRRSNGNDISGPPQDVLLDIPIPKKKRSTQCQQSVSPMEMFRRDLVKMLHQKEPSTLLKSSEDILIKKDNLSIYSETGLGAVLLKPSLISKELSEDISHVIDNKVPCLNTGSTCLSVQSQHNEINLSQIDSDKFILGTVDAKKRKENPEMNCAYTNKSSDNMPISNSDVICNKYYCRTYPSINGSLSSRKVITHTSHFVGSKFSMPVKKSHPPYFQACAVAGQLQKENFPPAKQP